MEMLVNLNYTDEHGLEAMGVKLLAGRFFRPEEIRYIDINYNGVPDKVIVTEALGRKFFPEGELVGRHIYYAQAATPIEIIGVIENVATAWLGRDEPYLVDTRYNFMLHPYMLYETGARYLVRAEPGQRAAAMAEVERVLLEAEPNRLLRSVYTQDEILKFSFSNDYATMIILLVVMGLMLLITGLGIVGLASFSVRQRTRQIGTRRALGARKRDILRYFLVENVLLTTLGVLVGGFLTYGLNFLLASQFGGERLGIQYFPGGVFILYLLGMIAVLGPARRASAIAPAIATRTV